MHCYTFLSDELLFILTLLYIYSNINNVMVVGYYSSLIHEHLVVDNESC